MEDSRTHRVDGGTFVDWTREASFTFVDEVDALETVTELGDELRSAREQVRQVMRYLEAAARAAHQQHDVSKQAIIGHSRVARQTIYTMLGEDQPS